jgi:prophage regulatory protein
MHHSTDNHTERLLRRPEVERLVGMTRSTLYARIKDNAFPRPVRIGPRAVAWRQSEISAWIENRTSEFD